MHSKGGIIVDVNNKMTVDLNADLYVDLYGDLSENLRPGLNAYQSVDFST